MTRNLIIAALLAASPAFVPGAAIAAAATTHYTAALAGANEVPPTTSTGTGTLDATFDPATKTLDYTLTWSGLTGPATMAHFHGPAVAGKNAGVQIVIGSANPTSPVHATATLNASQISQLDSGQWYVNVHSAKFPKGEIRGQVEKK